MSLKVRVLKFMNRVIYWLIILLPFSIAIAPAPTNILWAAALIFYLIKKIIAKEKIIIATPINKAFALFIIVSLVSMANTVNYGSSLRGVFKLIQYGLLYVTLASEIKERRHLERIVLFIILGALISGVDSFWQLIFGKDFIRGNAPIINIGLRRATAAFPNANVLGAYLAPIFAIACGMALYYFKGVKRFIFCMVSCIILSVILLTYSRAAILACYLGLWSMAIMKKDRIIIALLLILTAAFPFVLPKSAKEWARSVKYNPVIFMCNADRISIYKNAANMIKHHPVIGVGVNTFSINYLKYKLPEPDNARTGDTMYAHNNFLQIAGETGLLGLSVFIWLVFRIFQSVYTVYKQSQDRFYNALSLSLFAAILVFLVDGLTETNLYYKRISVIFWFIVGVAIALRNFVSAYNERQG